MGAWVGFVFHGAQVVRIHYSINVSFGNVMTTRRKDKIEQLEHTRGVKN